MNGYTNYETWATVLWMSNEYNYYNMMLDLVNHPANGPEEVEYVVCEIIDMELGIEGKDSGLGFDLLQYTLQNVDWKEVYDYFKEELED